MNFKDHELTSEEEEEKDQVDCFVLELNWRGNGEEEEYRSKSVKFIISIQIIQIPLSQSVGSRNTFVFIGFQRIWREIKRFLSRNSHVSQCRSELSFQAVSSSEKFFFIQCCLAVFFSSLAGNQTKCSTVRRKLSLVVIISKVGNGEEEESKKNEWFHDPEFWELYTQIIFDDKKATQTIAETNKYDAPVILFISCLRNITPKNI